MMKTLLKFLIVGIFIFPNVSFAQELSEAQICRAAIGTIMNRDADDVRIDKDKKQLKHLSFINFEDKVKWQFKCYIEKGQVFWATEMGSWRNTLLDPVVDYDVENKVLSVNVRHTDGSVFTKEFDIEKLMQKNDINRK